MLHDRAAALNGGSYLNISRSVRGHVNTLFESFVLDHIARRSSRAFETKLRSGITFDRTVRAQEAGFVIEMRYVALRDFSMHVERVRMRADTGGHSAPESVLRTIYSASIRNLPRAIREMDYLRVYDNSTWGLGPSVLLQAESGEVVYLAEDIPVWLAIALR